MSESPLISFEDAGKLMGGLHANTLRQRKAGTGLLTHVPMGRRVLLIRAEVEKLIEDRIAQAQADERKRRKTLRLVSNQI